MPVFDHVIASRETRVVVQLNRCVQTDYSESSHLLDERQRDRVNVIIALKSSGMYDTIVYRHAICYDHCI